MSTAVLDAPAGVRNLETFAGSVRDFRSLLSGSKVPGATDLDLMCERHGAFLVIEGKTWTPGYGVTVAYGQHKALKALAEQPAFTVLLVGEDRATGAFYGARYADLVAGYLRAGNQAAFSADQFTPTDRDGIRQVAEEWYDRATEAHNELKAAARRASQTVRQTSF